MTLVFDCETNGLLEQSTVMHSLCIYDTETGKMYSCTDNVDLEKRQIYIPISQGLKLLEDADEIAGHNIIKFDLPVIQKLYPAFKTKAKIYDTLIAARLAYPDIGGIDAIQIRKKQFPKKLYGLYSLKAFGYRLGKLKGTYCEQDNAWAEWSPEMQIYCERDVEVTALLLERLKSKNLSEKALELEFRFAHIISLQEQRGIQFNEEKAAELAGALRAEQLELEEKLREAFPDKVIETPFIPKSNNKSKGYVKGEVFIKKTIEPFKPSSRQQVYERLNEKYGWKPEKFTEPTEQYPKGQPVINDEVLKELPYPEAEQLSRYFLITKLLGYLTDGKNAWMKCVKDKVIHGGVTTIGAVTRRCTHQNPNLAQTPNSEAPYGKECRALFEAREGFKLIGCDAKALELRCLAHYMKDEEYTHEILNGDIHTKNQLAAGLPTRNNAKTFIYGFLYGAGDEKIGSIIGKGKKEGKKIKEKFLKNIPSLGRLIKGVQKAIEQRGYLFSLDKQKLKVREAYKGLNTLLQSCGAITMKKALCILFDWCIERGWIKDRYYLNDGTEDKVYFVLNIHDEYQAEVKPEIVKDYCECAVKAIQEAGKFFKTNCPFDGDVKEGSNWCETH